MSNKETRKVFVGGLNFEASAADVEGLFSTVGPVAEVFLPLDRATGKPRGFAFVEFEDEESMKAAVEKLDGHELMGRKLRVNEAQERPPRPPRPPSNFGGRGGGGGGRGGYSGGGRPPGKPKGSRRNARGKKRSL